MPPNVVKRAAEFCSTPKFERIFDDFARDNADVFMDAVEAKDGEVEHKHEYKLLHDKYLKLFEEELSDFIETEGATIDEFFRECRDIYESNYTALFDEHACHWFVEHLVACMDYKHFYGLMVNEARRSHRNKQHSQSCSSTSGAPVRQRSDKEAGACDDEYGSSGGAGQLGLGDEQDYSVPQRFASSKVMVRSVVTGGCHSAGIDAHGQLFVWGENAKHQLSESDKDGNRTQPESVVMIPQTARNMRTKSVACGWWHTIAVLHDEASPGDQDCLYSWGSNSDFQLGRRAYAPTDAITPMPVLDLPQRTNIESVACGWKHSLFATSLGQVFACGRGRHGELGLGGSRLATESLAQIDALQEESVRRVFCGWQHSLFQTSKGRLFICGSNRHGQLASPTSAKVNPLPIQVITDCGEPLIVAQVDVGWHFALCLTTTGDLLAWGKGSHGQLGNGSFGSTSTPQPVIFPSHLRIRQIACGSEHTLVATENGHLYSCGWGEHGNLGHGSQDNLAQLKRVEFFVDHRLQVASIVAGGAVSMAVTQAQAEE